jgi:hypothetical protein
VQIHLSWYGAGGPCVQVRRSQGRRSVGPQPGLFDDVAVLFHVAAWGLLGSENISCPIFSLGGDDRRGSRRAAPVVNGKISSSSGGVPLPGERDTLLCWPSMELGRLQARSHKGSQKAFCQKYYPMHSV